MCKGLIGKKLGMTTVFSPEGWQTPVTVVQAGPCVITQVKTEMSDGYNALQLGFGEMKKSKVKRPADGHFKKSGDARPKLVREVEADDVSSYSVGSVVSADIFQAGDRIDVIGFSKGRGFSGVIKRHGFHGGKETHGSKTHRIPGSVGNNTDPGKVIKGKRLPGRFGNERTTVRNLQIVDVRPDENIILLKGAVPGFAAGNLILRKAKY